jgi:hypothetical protein
VAERRILCGIWISVLGDIMNNIGYIKLAACLAAVYSPCQQAAMADDVSPSTQSSQTYPALAQAASTGTSPSVKKSFSLARLPVYIAGIATGAAVGMPISLVRRCIWEEKQGIQGLVGDSQNKVAIVSAGVFWLPFSAFLGAAEAPVMGPVNSLKNYDKPFSKEQFSLGAIGEGSSRDPG